MFNFYYINKYPDCFKKKIKSDNDLRIISPLLKVNEVNVFFKKINFFQQNLFKQCLMKLAFESKVMNWQNYMRVLRSFLLRYLHYNKTKWLILYSFVNLVFLSSSIEIKRLYQLIIFLLPLKKHKRKLFKLLFFFKKILFFLETNFIQAQVYFILKGKLGQKGDSKKSKHSLNFISIKEHRFTTIHSHDGIGKSSRFGHTFFRIKHTPFCQTKK